MIKDLNADKISNEVLSVKFCINIFIENWLREIFKKCL